MQASLPKMVRMVSVDDIGQGSEAIRILGVRWLPTGAAARSVGEDGQLKKTSDNDKSTSDRSVPGEGNIKNGTQGKDEDDDGQDDGAAEGMEAEEGDFVNMEIAFAYRPSGGRKRMKDRAKKAHLYMAFYLPSNIKLRKSRSPYINAKISRGIPSRVICHITMYYPWPVTRSIQELQNMAVADKMQLSGWSSKAL